MYAPAQDSEINGIIGYADQQLGAIRAAVYGLTDEQAASTPCRSALSVIGIVKHIERGMSGALGRLRGEADERVVDEASIAEYMGSFSLAEGESARDVLDRFDATRQEFLAALRDADPDADAVEPPAPWAGITEPRPIKTRFYLVHQIEEYARHAGHADIIREQIDGQSIAALEMSIAGAPANPFFTPFVPDPGTLA